MDGQGPVTFAFPRPGRALTGVLVALAALGIFQAFVSTWVLGGQDPMIAALSFDARRVFAWPPQLWRLVTSGLLTDSANYAHLAFTLLGLYFLGPSLEKKWGGRRFLVFLMCAVVVGNLVAGGLASVMHWASPDAIPSRFAKMPLFGPLAALTAIAVAWGRENADMQVRLFFFLPVKGKWLVWVTLGFLVLDLIFPMDHREGVVAPFGGFIAGLALAGTPSPLRRAYLQLKLGVLRRRRGALRAEELLEGPPSRPVTKARPGQPPLRVVQGGLDDVLRKRKPPKDKRFLN